MLRRRPGGPLTPAWCCRAALQGQFSVQDGHCAPATRAARDGRSAASRVRGSPLLRAVTACSALPGHCVGRRVRSSGFMNSHELPGCADRVTSSAVWPATPTSTSAATARRGQPGYGECSDAPRVTILQLRPAPDERSYGLLYGPPPTPAPSRTAARRGPPQAGYNNNGSDAA